MGGFYSWATPHFCMYRMPYDQLILMWRQGWINQKMQAVRLAGHIWGKDIDQAMMNQEDVPDPEEMVKKQFESEFGLSYEEYLGKLPKE